MSISIPPSWQTLPFDRLRGVLLVIGAPDTGKSTFARYLFQSLRNAGRKVAFLDGDPGQSALGPPATLTLAFDLPVNPQEDLVASGNGARRWFVGSTTPQAHMLPLLAGAGRLAQAAQQAGAEALVYDTSGLVDPGQGGLALKIAKIDLLQPGWLIAIQRGQELEPLLLPLRRSQRVEIVDLRPSAAVRPRDPQTRRENREAQFRRYFTGARPLPVDWGRLAIFPGPQLRLNRLVTLEDRAGFTLGLGIVTGVDRSARTTTLLTPVRTLTGVAALRLGDLLIDPHTFQHERI